MRSWYVMTAILASSAFGACGGETPVVEPGSSASSVSATADERAKSAKLRLDVNDVSILYPEMHDDDYAKLPSIAPFMPSAAYLVKARSFFNLDGERFELKNPVTGRLEAVDGATDTIPDGLREPAESYRVVSIRFDDCAPGVAGTRGAQDLAAVEPSAGGMRVRTMSGIKCVPQIRVVAQSSQSVDDAIHLVYSLVRSPATFAADFQQNRHQPLEDEAASVVADLQLLKLRSSTPSDGVPLGVHPGFWGAPATRDKFIELTKEFLAAHLRPELLTNVAFLSTNAFDGNDEWAMAGGAYSHARPEEFALAPILATKGAPLSQSFAVDTNFEPALTELPTLRSGSQRTGTENGSTGQPLPGFNIDEASIANLSKVHDPGASTLLVTDCFSCHRATHVLSNALFDAGGGDRQRRARQVSDSLKTSSAYGLRAGVTMIPQPRELQRGDANFHNFGFFEGCASVSLRVALESGAVAASINAKLFGDARGPGWSCPQAAFAPSLKKALDPEHLGEAPADLFARCTFTGPNGTPKPTPQKTFAPTCSRR